MNRYKLLILLMVCCSTVAFSQNETQLSQTVNNLGFVNPSYYGNSRDVEANILYTSRWGGLDKQTAFDLHGGLPYRHIGLSLKGQFENLGVRSRSIFGVGADVDLKVGCNSYILFGVFAGADLWRYNANEAVTEGSLDGYPMPNDYLKYNTNNIVSNFGITYVSGGFRLGSSFRWNIYDDIILSSESNYDNITFYGHAEYEFTVNSAWSFKPMALFTYNGTQRSNLDLGVFFGYDKIAHLGVFYRCDLLAPQEINFSKNLVLMADVTLFKSLSLFYSYDFNLSGMSNMGTTHEVGLRFNLNKALGHDISKKTGIRDFSW